MNICQDCKKEFNSKKSLSNHKRGGCRNLRKYEKICDCGKLLKYDSPSKFQKSIDENQKCFKCRKKLTKHSDETKNKISKTLKRLYDSGELIANMSGAHSEDSRKRISKTKSGQKLSETHKKNISEGVSNSVKFQEHVKDPIRNKKISERMKNRNVSNETRKKISKNRPDISGEKNPSKRPEVRKKLRIKLIERISLEIEKYGKKFTPFFNEKGCDFFENLMKYENSYIQHALNGGEFYIKELGYFVDGYDKENNVVYEWDEDHHYDVDGNLKQKDIERQKEIEDVLKCTFIRLKQSDFR